jgi:alcohol dehydrogenase (cytochrome c)
MIPSHAAPTAGEGELSAEVPYPESPNAWPADEPVGPAEGVSAAMLEDPFADGARWLHYGGDYRNHRHSPSRLNPAAARRLAAVWAFGTGTKGQFEVSPIVYGGVMYVTSSYNRVFALDAKSGEMLWRYDHQLPEDLRLCCGPPNRGPAIHGDTLLMSTLDAKLLALDRRTGTKRWEVTLADYQEGMSLTAAPLVVGDLAVIGIAGGEFGARGFFDAYRVADGERAWRHYTVPGKPGDPGEDTWAGNSYETGGAPAWTTGAYDAEADVLYWTTGNPSPDWNGDLRKGDNLYSNSVLAVVPQTGELKWHFQFTPHDVWDYDGNTQIFLVDAEWEGSPRKLLVQANRNGFFYVLDRESGEFLRATQYVEQLNWASIDSDGRPVVNPKAVPLPQQPRRYEWRLDGGLQPRARSGVHSLDRGLPTLREGHRHIHQRCAVHGGLAGDDRRERGQSLRPHFGGRRRHRKDPLAIPRPPADDGRCREYSRRRRDLGDARRTGSGLGRCER